MAPQSQSNPHPIYLLCLSLISPCVVRSIRSKVQQRIQLLQATYPGFQPQLAVVQAGDRPDSSSYIRMKAKAAEDLGIKFNHIKIPEDTSLEETVEIVKILNDDDHVSGILVQLPLGDHIGRDGERIVTQAISAEKDVDGYASFNMSIH